MITNIYEEIDEYDKIDYKYQLFSNTLLSLLILFMLYKYITTRNKIWLFSTINSLLIITLFGNTLRDTLTSLNIYEKRPIYKKQPIDNYKTNGMPSLHSMSVLYILTTIINNKNIHIKQKLILCCIGVGCLMLRYISEIHNLKQIVIGSVIGINLSYLLKIDNYKNLIIFVSTLLTIKYLILNKRYNNIKYKIEEPPVWFDTKLQERYEIKISKSNESIFFRNYVIRCHSLLYYKNNTYALPYMITWKDIELGIDNLQLNEMPDIIVGIKSGGAFITKYIANKYKLPYDYISIQKYDKKGLIHMGIKTLNNDLFCSDIECIYKNDKLTIKENISLDVTDKNILLVDDTVSSGSTLYNGMKHMYDKGAKDVKTLVFTSQNDKYNIIDYSIYNKNFIGWPWGMDA